MIVLLWVRVIKSIKLKWYKSDVSLSQIARIETGKINPTLCTIIIIAKTLNIDPKKLLDFEVWIF